jgi:transposase
MLVANDWAPRKLESKGDVYIRRLLILGGTSLVRYSRGPGASTWAAQLLQRRPTRVVTVALANRAARVIWALLARGGVYQASMSPVV